MAQPASDSSSKPPHPLPRLREWRLSQGFTLQHIADLTRWDITALSRIERGHRQLRPIDKAELSRDLGVRLRVLFPDGP